MGLYIIANGPMPTTAAQVPVTTGTAIKTLLQIKPFNLCKIVEWGISFDGFAAATPIRCELLETGAVFATVTASADADVAKLGPNIADAAAASVAGLTLGTAATGYSASAEGTITAVRMLDVQFVAPSNQYVKQFPLGREPVIAIGSAGRIRVTAGAAVNAYCYMIIEL
jgi:hypothetical protein